MHTVLVHEAGNCESEAQLRYRQPLLKGGKLTPPVQVHLKAAYIKVQKACLIIFCDFIRYPCFCDQMNPTSSTGFPTIGISSELTNPTYLPFQQMQQLDSCSGLDMGINDPNTGLQKTTTAPMPISEPFFDSSCFAVIDFLELNLRILNLSC